MKKIIFLILCIFLSGCFGTSKPADFYVLQPQTRLSPIQTTHFNIGVEAVELPTYLDRPQIVWQKDDSSELKVSELNRWGEPLSEMIQRTLTGDLARLLPNAFIKPKTFSRDGFNRIILVEIDRFDAIEGKEAFLSAWWSVSNAEGATLMQDKTVLSAPTTGTYENYARVQSDLIAQLAEQIAKKIK